MFVKVYIKMLAAPLTKAIKFLMRNMKFLSYRRYYLVEARFTPSYANMNSINKWLYRWLKKEIGKIVIMRT